MLLRKGQGHKITFFRKKYFGMQDIQHKPKTVATLACPPSHLQSQCAASVLNWFLNAIKDAKHTKSYENNRKLDGLFILFFPDL